MLGIQDYNNNVSCVSIKDNCIVFYNKYIGQRYMTDKFLNNMSNLSNTKGNGVMKGKKESRAKAILSNWLNCSNTQRLNKLNINDVHARKHTFVTLTLPCNQIHTDQEIKRLCLTPFIQRITTDFKIKHYYWRAESQKNGNIHFHIIVDNVVKWQELRRLWNLQLKKIGYIEIYRQNQKEFYSNGFKMSNNPLDMRTMEQQYKAYISNLKSNFSDPNSTDIHSFRDINNITAYVVKYMTKEQGYRKITGRLHGYSDGLNTIDNFKIEGDSYVSHLANELKKDKSIKEIIQERCCVYIVDSVKFMKDKKLKLLEVYSQFVNSNLQHLYNFKEQIVQQLILPIYEPKPVVFSQLSLF